MADTKTAGAGGLHPCDTIPFQGQRSERAEEETKTSGEWSPTQIGGLLYLRVKAGVRLVKQSVLPTGCFS